MKRVLLALLLLAGALDASAQIYYNPGGGGVGGGSFTSPGAGIPVDTNGSSSWAARCLAASTGISIANTCGAAGNFTISIDTSTTPQFSSGTPSPSAGGSVGTFYFETDRPGFFTYPATNTLHWVLTVPSPTVAGSLFQTSAADTLAAITPTDDSTLVSDGSTWAKKTLPACTDSGGNHLNYDQATNAFSCGTSSSGGGSLPVDDATGIAKGSGDATKIVRFEVDGFTTGTTRVLTPPDANITLAGQDFANVFTQRATFGSAVDAANAVDLNETAGCITFEGSSADANESRLCATNPSGDRTINLPNAAGTVALSDSAMTWSSDSTMTAANRYSWGTNIGNIMANTPQTPDAWLFEVGTVGESMHVIEAADQAFDFNNGKCGTSACSDPAVIIHSRNQNTAQYLQLSSQNATGAGEVQTNLANILIGGSKSAITESSAIAILRVGIPTSTNVYGLTVDYTIYDVNGANYVGRSGHVTVQGGNSSGTATCTINTAQDQETEDGSQIATSNAATLTYTWTNAASTTNCDLTLNAASSEGVNTYGITYNAHLTGNSSAITLTPQ